MASTRNVTGVVLRRRAFKHADRIYHIFTKEEGKVVARAQGVLKIKSKLAGQLEPYRVSEFHIARSKTIDKIAGCVSVGAFPMILRDLSKCAAAAVMCEIVDGLHREGQPDLETWELLTTGLSLLNDKSVNLLTIYSFCWKMLGIAGFQPQWEACVICHSVPHHWAYVDVARGGGVCTDCLEGPVEGGAECITTLQFLDDSELEEAKTHRLSQAAWNHVAQTVRLSYERASDRQLRSLEELHRQIHSHSKQRIKTIEPSMV